MLMKQAIAACAMMLLIATTAHAKDDLAVGLKAGDAAPANFSAVDTDGSTVKLATIMGEKGAILLFVRSLEWCPFCTKQVREWSARAAEFKERGYHVTSLSYDAPEVVKAFADKHALQVTTLSDTDSKMIMAFGLLNTTMQPGTRFYGIPHPAIYVIGKDGTITHRFSEEGYKDRPVIEEVLEVLK